MRKTNWYPFRVAILLLCVSLVVFGGWLVKLGFDQRDENANLREICTEEVAGTVTGYHRTGERYTDDEGEVQDTRQDYPVYQYEAGGRKYTVQSARYDSKGSLRYKSGEKIAVRFAPGDPEKHYLPSEEGYASRNAWLCVGFGVFLFIFFGFGTYKTIAG